MPFCSNCGTEIPEGVKFCSNCGSAIGEVKTATPEIETNPVETAEPDKKKALPVFGIIAFVLAIIGFFGDPPALTIIVS